jgi:hypothetical protein
MARSAHINPGFTEPERARLAAAAAAAGMTPTAWLRHLALRHLDATQPAAPPSPLPPAAEPVTSNLSRTVGTRLTPEHYEAVEDRARLCGLSVAAYVRLLVLGGTPVARRSEVRSAIVAINRVGGNLNQLVKLANSGVVLLPDLLREVTGARAEIDTLRQALLAALRGDPTAAIAAATIPTGDPP